ncbi:MAG: ACP S-malonyltransferase [Candidatus Eremiobacteraeota bacterium]|nr:ACP S-malonyltransferase [Candidatus Eremiobacteraeota bacterium]MBV8497834.1 ACP S-malonyltransferase [Candidatus Eremiobacteraeota bacterium]
MGRRRVALGGLMRVGVVFPGQGSQGVGMGCDIAAHSREALATFERASALLGYDLLALQKDGPEDKLRETEYSQPAIFATNIALYRAVGAAMRPAVTAGHSFAELCSLVIADSLDFDDALRIVSERGKAMQDAAQRARGGMSAILGLDARRVRETLQESGLSGVSLANFNSPTQIVISGVLEQVQSAGAAMLAAGAKRVVPLNVSGAWHSPLMEPAVERLAAAVEAGRFRMPRFDVISNVDGRPYRDIATIKQNLIRSVVDEVRWHDTAERVLSYALDMIAEFGASGVLSALMKRMAGAPTAMVVSDFSGVERLRVTIAGTASASV